MMAESVRIIDISHWQGNPDFAKVRAQGVIACIMKATEGTSFRDPVCAANTLAAQKNGIKCCTYHWLKPRKFASATAQMKFYLATIDPVPGERVIIDYEENGCTLQDLIEAVTALKADPRKLQVTIYSGHLLKEQLNGVLNTYLSQTTDLWLAQYTAGTPSWPDKTWPHWRLWQYSETGKLDGIQGSAVDLNHFVGTDAELLAWISPAVASAVADLPVSPPVDLPPIHYDTIEVDRPNGAPIVVRVNGKEVYRG